MKHPPIIEVTPEAGRWVIRIRSRQTGEAVIVGNERLAADALQAARLGARAFRLDVTHHLEELDA